MVDITPVQVAPMATKAILKSATIIFADNTATIHGALCDEEGNELKPVSCVLSVEEYQQWSDDDSYVLDKLCEKSALAKV